MLSGEGNENGEKTAIGLMSQKKNNFACAAHFFCMFLYCCLARPQCETSRNLLVTRFMEEMPYLFLFIFFRSLIFTFVAFRISHFLTADKKFSCCSSNNQLLIFHSSSLSLFFSLSFTGLSPTLFLSVLQICRDDN